jgi:hypothetical protein
MARPAVGQVWRSAATGILWLISAVDELRIQLQPVGPVPPTVDVGTWHIARGSFLEAAWFESADLVPGGAA